MSKSVMSKRGFSLVELLTVVSIIGILAVIAVVNFSGTKQKAFDKEAITILKTIANAEEAYFLDNDAYFSCIDSECAEFDGVFQVPDDVSLEMTSQPNSFTGIITHSKGTGVTCRWDSEAGGFQGCN